MEMLIHLTERLFAPSRWMAFGDGESAGIWSLLTGKIDGGGFPCIQVMDATRRIRMLGRCARDSEFE